MFNSGNAIAGPFRIGQQAATSDNMSGGATHPFIDCYYSIVVQDSIAASLNQLIAFTADSNQSYDKCCHLRALIELSIQINQTAHK